MANSLIRVASTRIFSNPAQSVVELIVNSIDSYNQGENKSIGRFGMGFFSILYWIFKIPDCFIILQSKTVGGEEFCIRIYVENKILKNEFTKFTRNKFFGVYEGVYGVYDLIELPYESGTKISIYGLSEEIINNFTVEIIQKLK